MGPREYTLRLLALGTVSVVLETLSLMAVDAYLADPATKVGLSVALVLCWSFVLVAGRERLKWRL